MECKTYEQYPVLQSASQRSDTEMLGRNFVASILVSVLLLASPACSLFSGPKTEAPPPDARISTFTQGRPIHRKIIEFGWDLPSADFVAANITRMERRPFDGIVFRPGPADVQYRGFDV